MKCIILLSMVIASAIADVPGYDIDLEGWRVEDVENKPEALRPLILCFMDAGPCDKIASVLKVNARDTIVTTCAKCNKSQRHLVNGLIVGFEKYLPEEYEDFKKFFDPTGKLIPALAVATAGN